MRIKRIAQGFGPLSFAPEGGEGGSGQPAGGGTPPAATPPAQPGTTPPTTPPPAPEQTIPYARFAEVNDGYQKLLKEKQDREAADMAAKGEHEKLATAEKAKREAAEQRAITIGRRAAFVAKAAGKAQDPEAAYKLAQADGLLSAIEVDDEGNATDPKKVDEALDAVLKKYEFLKAGTKTTSFGEPAGGNGPQNGQPEPKTAQDMLSLGYSQLGAPTRR